MPKDNQVLVRVNDPTNRAIEEFAEDRDYNKAEAVREIAKSRLTSEGYLNQELYGESSPVTDGGEIESQLEEQSEDLEQIDAAVKEAKEASEELGEVQRLQNILLAVGITWLLAYYAVGFTTSQTALTGVPIALVILYTFVKQGGIF